MANIFQQSLEQIPVKGYVPTTQKDTATPELIAAVGKEARAIDIAREESILRGSTADEVPTADVWNYQELPGPVRPGEAPPVMPIKTEVFDASAELNLNQIIKARKQGLITPTMAETRANAALRRAINRRPGRQQELTQAYNEFLGVYDGITEETEAERLRSDEAKRQAAIEDHYIKKYGMDAETGMRWQQEQTIQEMQEFRTDVPSRSAADMYARQAETMIANKLKQVFDLPVGEQQQALAALQLEFADIKGQFLNRYGQMARDAGWKDDFVRKDNDRLASRIDDMIKRAGDTNISNMFQKGMNAVKGYSDMQTAKELPPVVWSIMTKLPPDDVGRIIAVANKMKDAGVDSAEYEKLKNDHKFYGIYADMIVRGQSASEIQKRFEQDTSTMLNNAGPDHPYSMTPQVAGQLANRMATSDNTSETDKFILDKRTINLGLRDPMALEFVLDPDFVKRVNSNPALKNHLVGVVNTQYLALKNAINDDRLIERAKQENQGYFGMRKSTGAGGAMAEVFADEISAYMNNKYKESLHTLFKVQDLYKIAPDLDQTMPSESAQKKSPKVSDIMSYKYTADQLYDAFSSAETGGEKDPFIRTKVRTTPNGSTAYGPVQITASLARGMLKNHGDRFDEEETSYLKKFIAQGETFLKYGNEHNKNGFDPRYDYGGSGDLNDEESRAVYAQIAKKFLQIEYEASGGDINKTIRRWRGANPEAWYDARIKQSLEV